MLHACVCAAVALAAVYVREVPQGPPGPRGPQGIQGPPGDCRCASEPIGHRGAIGFNSEYEFNRYLYYKSKATHLEPTEITTVFGLCLYDLIHGNREVDCEHLRTEAWTSRDQEYCLDQRSRGLGVYCGLKKPTHGAALYEYLSGECANGHLSLEHCHIPELVC